MFTLLAFIVKTIVTAVFAVALIHVLTSADEY
jgi:hypothetical protein